MSFATSTPLAFTVCERDCGECEASIVAIYPWREDWFGYNIRAYELYHVTTFRADKGISEINGGMCPPEKVAVLRGREAVKGFWSEYASEEIPDAAFEGRVR